MRPLACLLLFLATATALAASPDKKVSRAPVDYTDCAAFLRTLPEGRGAGERIDPEKILGTLDVPRSHSIKPLTTRCPMRTRLPEELPGTRSAQRVAIRAGRLGGLPWIAYAYPAVCRCDNHDEALAIALVVHHADGRPRSMQPIGWLTTGEGVTAKTSATLRPDGIELCRQTVDSYHYDDETGDVLGMLPVPERTACVRSRVPLLQRGPMPKVGWL